MEFIGRHIVVLQILLPLFTAAIVALFPKKWRYETRLVSQVASFASFLGALLLFLVIDKTGELDFIDKFKWIPAEGINVNFALDGTSSMFMLFSSFAVFLASVFTRAGIDEKIETKGVFMSLLVCLGGILGVLTTQGSLPFLFFWMLVHLSAFFMIGFLSREGQKRSMQFAGYSLISTFLLVVAFAFCSVRAGSTDFISWYLCGFSVEEQMALLVITVFAFSCMSGIFPFHRWLVDSSGDSDVLISILFFGVFVNVGCFGLSKFAMPMFPIAVAKLSFALLSIFLLSMLASFVVALGQTDTRKLTAYVVAVMNAFFAFGIFVLDKNSAAGASFSINYIHLTAAAFVALSCLIEPTTYSYRLSGLKIVLQERVPMAFAAYGALLSLACVGGSAGFVGIFMVLLGAFQMQTELGAVSIFCIMIFGLIVFAVFEHAKQFSDENSEKVRFVEKRYFAKAVLMLVVVVVLMSGVFPASVLDRITGSSSIGVELAKRTNMYDIKNGKN